MSNRFESKDLWENLGISDEVFNSLKWERIQTSDIKPGSIEFVEQVGVSEKGIEGISFCIKNADGQINIINILVDEEVKNDLLLGSLLKIERAIIPSK